MSAKLTITRSHAEPRRYRDAIVVILSVVAVASALGQTTARAQPSDLKSLFGPAKTGRAAIPKPVLVATTERLPDDPGAFRLAVAVQLPADHYIYATSGAFGGRTKISLDSNSFVAQGDDFVPNHPGKTAHEELFGTEVTKFYDDVTWSRIYRTASGEPLPTDAFGVHGQLEGQYCSGGSDGGQCYPIIPPLKFSATLAGNADAVSAPPVVYSSSSRASLRKGPGPIGYHFELSPKDASAGEAVTLKIVASVDQGWHTFSQTQTDEGGQPTVISVTQLAGLEELSSAFDESPEPAIEQSADGYTLKTLHGDATWSRRFRVTATTPGDYGVGGKVNYQVCKTSCIPGKVAFELGRLPKPGVVEPNAATSLATGPIPTASQQPGGGALVDLPPRLANVPVRVPSSAALNANIWGLLLTAVLGGFAALLTPCSFPMVPITVGFFLKQDRSKAIGLALVYALTMIAAFTVLGVGFAALFGPSFINGLANNPWVNLGIGMIFVAFGLNLLGLFEIQIPSWLLTFTANKESAGGYLGVVFMAVTFTLTSFTCTFPVAGSILVLAAQGSFVGPIIGMLGFGTAFALPFFFLALFPGWLQTLPKSGGWMYQVKVVLGLLEIGAAVKYLSIADFAWNPNPAVFDFNLVMLVWIVIALTIGLYLLGQFRLPNDTPNAPVGAVQLMFAMVFLGLAGFLTIGLAKPNDPSGVIMPQILAFAPPRFETESISKPFGGPFLVEHGQAFSLDIDEALAFAKAQQQPLFLDFTGVNCNNCRLMEIKMAQPRNHERLERFVRVKLYADNVPTITDATYAKRLLERNVQLQIDWFGHVALPSYAVVSPDGQTVFATFEGLELIDGEFAKFLDEGYGKWRGHSLASANDSRSQ